MRSAVLLLLLGAVSPQQQFAAEGDGRPIALVSNLTARTMDLDQQRLVEQHGGAWEFHTCAGGLLLAAPVLARVEVVVVVDHDSSPCLEPRLLRSVAAALGNSTRRGVPPLLQLMMTGVPPAIVAGVPPEFAVANIHASAASLAEWVIAAMLESATALSRIDAGFRGCTWRTEPPGNTNCPDQSELHGSLLGKRMCVLGYGSIGSEVAGRAHAFGVEIHATALVASDTPPSPLASLSGGSRTEAEQCAGAADFVVIALPITPQTRGLVDRAMLSAMKPSAMLLNPARGEIVDESALFEALRHRSIRAAALDVWWNNSNGRNSHWSLPNATGPMAWPSRLRFDSFPFPTVIMTPHVASRSDAEYEARFIAASRQLDRLASGQPPDNIIRAGLHLHDYGPRPAPGGAPPERGGARGVSSAGAAGGVNWAWVLAVAAAFGAGTARERRRAQREIARVLDANIEERERLFGE